MNLGLDCKLIHELQKQVLSMVTLHICYSQIASCSQINIKIKLL
jgi:hypothetical protein